MNDTGQDLDNLAESLAELVKEAAYVAVGAGVLGFQKAQVRRQELIRAARHARRLAGISRGFASSFSGGREQMASRATDFDATVVQVIKLVDSTLEPVLQRLPEGMQTILLQAREARDELRTRVFGSSA